jgi:fatty acid desaturase
MHEGVHGLISKNKTVNNIAGELFCAWPLFISMRSYGLKHLAHHAWLNTDKDPDFNAKTNPNWQYPMKLIKFIKLSILQLSGIGVFETLKVMSGAKVKLKNKEKTPPYYHALRLLFYVVIFSTFLAIDQGRLLLLYWIIPFATWTQFTNRMRRIAEHSGIDGKTSDMQTRTTIHSRLGRFLLSPRNISYHNEHHIYPGVPCYNLPKLHAELTSTAEMKDSLHISKSYKTVFKECVIKPN